MTQPVIEDPQLSAFWASDPSVLQAESPEPAPTEHHSRKREIIEVAVALAAAFLVVRTLIARDLAQQSAPEDVQGKAAELFNRHLPTWMKLAIPAIRHTYQLGKIEGLSEDEIQSMAADYAANLGDYVNTTSAQALADGFNAQLNQRWSERIAWERARAGYGLERQQMLAHVTGLMSSKDTSSTDLIPGAARMLVDKALINRADRLGQAESWRAMQSGRAIMWLLQQQAGTLPATAAKRWLTDEEGTDCRICGPLHNVEVGLGEMFTAGDGQLLFAPGAHPHCHCHLELVTTEEIAKLGVSVAGLCVRAADTGRVLMLQRAIDEKDPAGGMWELPGGHLDRDETPLDGARREWEEEVRRRLPASARVTDSWTSGIYQGFIVTVPSESVVPHHSRGRVANPDDPDRDAIEAIAWWDIEHLSRNPAVRPELRAALPQVRDALGVVAKNVGADHYNRKPDGQFARREQRQTRTATLERDAVVDDIMAQARAQALESPVVESSNPLASSKPSNPLASTRAAVGNPLGATGNPLAPARAVVNPLAVNPLAAKPANPLKSKGKTIQGQRRLFRRTVLLPQFPRRAEATHDPYYLPWQDVANCFEDPDVSYTRWDRGDWFDFAEANESNRWQHEAYSGYNDEDDPAPGNLAAVASTQFTHLTEQMNYELEAFWEENSKYLPAIRSDAEHNAENTLQSLNANDIASIYFLSGYELGESDPDERKARILSAVRRDGGDRGLAQAYIDYVAFVRPGTVGEAGQYLANELHDQDGEFADLEEIPTQDIMVFDKGFAPGDGHGEGNLATLDGKYQVRDVEYHSAWDLMGSDAPAGIAGYRLIYMEPYSG